MTQSIPNHVLPAAQGPSPDLSLSVFLPCFNEQGNVERVVRRAMEVLPALASDWEIIIVDDGSRDATGEIADRLAAADARVRAVHHATNGGYGMALRSGFAAATKEYVFFTDGDGQFDIAELAMLLERRGRGDIIAGYRRRRSDNVIRRLNAWCWGLLVCRVLKFRCRDVDSAFKLMRRDMVADMPLRSTGALINAEILSRAVRSGCTIVQAPVSHYPRRQGKATGARLGVIFRAFRELLKLRGDIMRNSATARSTASRCPAR